MLSDIAPKNLNHFLKTHLSKTLNLHFGPTDIIYSGPTEMTIPLPQPKPQQFGLTKMVLGPTETTCPSFCDEVVSFRNHRDELIGITETRSCPSHCTLVSPSWFDRSHQKSQHSYLLHQSASPTYSYRSHRFGSKLCNGWILGEGNLYPSTPTYSLREPSE